MSKLLRKHWKENTVLLLLIIGIGISTVLAAFSNSKILDALINQNINLLILGLFQLASTYALILFLTYLLSIKQAKVIQKMSLSLRSDILKKITALSYPDYHKENVGTYTSWVTNDINQIEQMGFISLYELIAGIVNSILAIVALLSVHWSLVILTLVEVLLLLKIPTLFGNRIEKSTKELTKQNEKFLSDINDSLSAYDTVITFKKIPYILKKVYDASKSISDSKNKQARVMTNVSIACGTGNVVSQILIHLLTAFLALHKIITVGSLTVTGSFASEIFNTVGNLSQYIAAIGSTKPLFEKFDEIEVTNENGNNNSQSVKLKNGFDLSNVSYQYEGKNTLFDNLNFKFNLGGKYAIIGESGSGKTTLLNILTGKQKNYSGQVLFNNEEIKSLAYDQIFSNILYIEQNPHIFNDTIRENLSMGEHFSDEELWESLESSSMKETVSLLPNKLDTHVGENGKFLSGGQKQRLAIARGLLRNKEILILDESTSSLDKKTARFIEEKLVKIKNITIIMITHHLSKKIESQLDNILYLT